MSMRLQRAILAVVIVALWAGAVVVHHDFFTKPYPGHNDFLTPWEAARSFFVEGIPVYSDKSNENIQIGIYGRPIEEGEFPNYYAYPFHTLFLVWPTIYLSYDWATAVWMVALEAALIVALFLLLDIYRWKPRPLMLVWLLVWMLFFYPSARGLILGQVSHLIFLLQVVGLWSVVRGRDTTAGLALAFSTAKPQMGYLIVPFLLLWALRERRWRLIGVFAGTLAALLALSFALQPDWVGGWLGELGRYTDYTAVGSPVWVVMAYYLGLGSGGEWAAVLVFYAALLWTWYQVLVRRHDDRFLWTAMLTLTITHLVAPRTATTHFVVFAAPLLFYIARWSRQGKALWAALFLLALLVLPWLHFVNTVSGEFEHPATYVPLPFGVALLLWFTRRQWWQPASDTLISAESSP